MIVSKRSLDALQSKYDILKLNCALLEKSLSDSRANESLLEKERDLWKQKHSDLNEYSDKELSNTVIAAGQKTLAAGIGEQSATLDVMMSRIISIYEATCTIRTGGPKKKRSIGDERKSKKKKSK